MRFSFCIICELCKFACAINHTLNIATQSLLQNKKGQSIDCPKVAGVGLEPHDLRVMSPTSYQLLHPAMYLYSNKEFRSICRCKDSAKRSDIQIFVSIYSLQWLDYAFIVLIVSVL